MTSDLINAQTHFVGLPKGRYRFDIKGPNPREPGDLEYHQSKIEAHEAADITYREQTGRLISQIGDSHSKSGVDLIPSLQETLAEYVNGFQPSSIEFLDVFYDLQKALSVDEVDELVIRNKYLGPSSRLYMLGRKVDKLLKDENIRADDKNKVRELVRELMPESISYLKSESQKPDNLKFFYEDYYGHDGRAVRAKAYCIGSYLCMIANDKDALDEKNIDQVIKYIGFINKRAKIEIGTQLTDYADSSLTFQYDPGEVPHIVEHFAVTFHEEDHGDSGCRFGLRGDKISNSSIHEVKADLAMLSKTLLSLGAGEEWVDHLMSTFSAREQHEAVHTQYNGLSGECHSVARTFLWDFLEQANKHKEKVKVPELLDGFYGAVTNTLHKCKNENCVNNIHFSDFIKRVSLDNDLRNFLEQSGLKIEITADSSEPSKEQALSVIQSHSTIAGESYIHIKKLREEALERQKDIKRFQINEKALECSMLENELIGSLDPLSLELFKKLWDNNIPVDKVTEYLCSDEVSQSILPMIIKVPRVNITALKSLNT